MVTTSSQISVVLSGGSSNSNPNLALGGSPSNAPININNPLNNLFDDISPSEAEVGLEDYRCFYVFNDSDDPVYNFRLWMTADVEDGSTITLGIQNSDEIQRYAITGVPTGGTFTLTYLGKSFTSNYDSDLGAWATAIEVGLNALQDNDGNPLLTGVIVAAQTTSTGIIFDITFADYDGQRIHDTLIADSSLEPETVSATLTVLQNGAPINTIASALEAETTTPSGVTFFTPSEIEPISVPRLESGEGFPIWVRRRASPGVTAVANDGFSLRIRMTALK